MLLWKDLYNLLFLFFSSVIVLLNTWSCMALSHLMWWCSLSSPPMLMVSTEGNKVVGASSLVGSSVGELKGKVETVLDWIHKSPESFEYTPCKDIFFSSVDSSHQNRIKKIRATLHFSQLLFFFSFCLLHRKVFCKQKGIKREGHNGTEERNAENASCWRAVLLIASPTIKFWCLWKAGRATSSVIICLQAVGASKDRRQPAVRFLFLDFLFWHQLALKHLMCLTGRKDSYEMV